MLLVRKGLKPNRREGRAVRLLLVEDTEDVAEAIMASFQQRGDAIDCVDSVEAASDTLAVNDYEVVILDINLPDGEGTEVLRALRRQRKATPVLMLTARMAVEERVGALDLGADDYLVKPFDLRELQARVRALRRRTGPDRGGVIEFGDLALDPAGRTATSRGVPLELTRREFSLLEALMANRSRIMPKERLFDRIFTIDEEEVGLNAIETYVARLRRKLEGSGVGIRTLRGLGYQLVRTD
jgi:two-component system response regulator TctD